MAAEATYYLGRSVCGRLTREGAARGLQGDGAFGRAPAHAALGWERGGGDTGAGRSSPLLTFSSPGPFRTVKAFFLNNNQLD